MIIAQSVPLGIDRGAPRVFTIEIIGIDLTGADLHAQIRLTRDAPGDPIVDLPKVTDPTIAGVRLVATDTSGTLPVSWIRLQIPAMTTGTGAGQLPPAAELGDDVMIYWDMFVTPNGRTTDQWFYGPVTISATVTKSATLPALVNDPLPGADAVATLVGADLTVTLAGAALIQPLIDRADGSAAAAVDAAAHAETKAQQATDAATLAGLYNSYSRQQTLDQRDAIPINVRRNGMAVFVNDTGKWYRLAKDNTNSGDAGTWSSIAIDNFVETDALKIMTAGERASLAAADTINNSLNPPTIAARDAIPLAARRNGLTAFVPETGKWYRLAKDNTNASDAGVWVAISVDQLGETATAKIMTAGERALLAGAVALDGYEADLCGYSDMTLDSAGKLLTASPLGGGEATFTKQSFYAGIDVVGTANFAQVSLGGGVIEQAVFGYEADLCGYAALTLDQDGKIVDSTPYGKALTPTTVTIGDVTETGIAGYEADLCGYLTLTLDQDGKLIEGAPYGTTSNQASSAFNDMDGSDAGHAAWVSADTAGLPQIMGYDATSGKTKKLTSSASNTNPRMFGRKVAYVSTTGLTATRKVQDVAGGYEFPFATLPDLVIWGDSFGEDPNSANSGSGISTVLKAMFPGLGYATEAIGGQRSLQISQRMDAVPTFFLVSSNSIPASGAVAVLPTGTLDGLGLLQSSANRTIQGILYGTDGSAIAGTLTFTASGATYAFTRALAGSAVAVPAAGALFVPTTGISGNPISTLLSRRNIIETGRNDVGKTEFSLANVQARDALMIAAIGPVAKSWCITGINYGRSDVPTSLGGANTSLTEAQSLVILQQIKSINDYRKAAYPQFFADFQQAAIDAGLTSPLTIGGIAWPVPSADFSGTDTLHPVTNAAKVALSTSIFNVFANQG